MEDLMITKYDLYDMSYALTLIRNHICEESNKKILFQMITVLKSKDDIAENQIRKALSSIKELNREQWSFVYYNNVYVNHQILKNPDVYILLENVLQNLIYTLDQGTFDKAYDLVDCFHCLPDIIADNNCMLPKSFWRRLVEYRVKWDSDFLKNEQKAFKRHHKQMR